ncbi:Crp/Fnr family transcriptional regulator [Ureibacillus sp. 179-F W5.1 NHS]|uniref:Crp/Fnr family transcriptional regulator n=1 Tax=unclassified Ureibacillus TaxID=2638520 RepID=UPI003119C8AF
MELESSLKLIEQLAKKIHARKGQIIYQAGEEANNVYFLNDGIVKIAIDGDDGHPVTISLIRMGEMFGFLDRLNNRLEHTQYAVAMTDVELFVLPIEILTQHLNKLSEMERSLFYSLGKRLIEAQEFVYVHSKMTIPERLGWLLKKLAKVENNILTISIPLTHEEISFMIGCSRQKVTTYLSKWKKEGVIQYERGFIQLMDLEKLQ